MVLCMTTFTKLWGREAIEIHGFYFFLLFRQYYCARTLPCTRLDINGSGFLSRYTLWHFMALSLALQNLPINEQQVILLFYIGNYNRKDIASFLDIPISTVDNRLRNERQKLREKVNKMAEEHIRPNAPSRDEQFVKQVRNSVEQTWSWYESAYKWSKSDTIAD